ncbi:MAG: glycosyltransferase family 4 protein [Lysobacter sp.]|nr:glycosyltransferase family 4 protein [Lysobacter sp.]
MRVLLTADAVGGVLTYALDLTRSLTDRGTEVHLAVLGQGLSPDQRVAVLRAGAVSVHECTGALEWMPDPWTDVDRAGEWLLALAGHLRPDVVHLNGYAHAALPWPSPVLVAGHSCVLSWWEAVHGTAAPPDWAEYRRRVQTGLAAADVVVAPTAAMLGALQRWYGVIGGVVVPNGRRPEPVPPLDKEPLVLGAGRVWDEAKNLHRLVAAAPRLSWPVVVAGDATAPGGDEVDLPAGARLTGRLSWAELSLLMQRAAVLAAPSSYEPFGLTPLEAAQAGCALVLGDIASLREVWGDAALYVDPQDEDALVAALERLASDRSLLERFGGRSRVRAAHYSPDRMGTAYLELYDRISTREQVPA